MERRQKNCFCLGKGHGDQFAWLLASASGMGSGMLACLSSSSLARLPLSGYLTSFSRLRLVFCWNNLTIAFHLFLLLEYLLFLREKDCYHQNCIPIFLCSCANSIGRSLVSCVALVDISFGS